MMVHVELLDQRLAFICLQLREYPPNLPIIPVLDAVVGLVTIESVVCDWDLEGPQISNRARFAAFGADTVDDQAAGSFGSSSRVNAL